MSVDERGEVLLMEIRQATVGEVMEVARLALMLWPEHSMHAIALEIYEAINANRGAYFLAFEGTEIIGFSQTSLRSDYVEGTSSSPVGYLEGIFVLEPYRKQGIGQQLLTACENWAREQGCEEFASDCELTNEESLNFHRRLGFEEANRIICFRKLLTQ